MGLFGYKKYFDWNGVILEVTIPFEVFISGITNDQIIDIVGNSLIGVSWIVDIHPKNSIHFNLKSLSLLCKNHSNGKKHFYEGFIFRVLKKEYLLFQIKNLNFVIYPP